DVSLQLAATPASADPEHHNLMSIHHDQVLAGVDHSHHALATAPGGEIHAGVTHVGFHLDALHEAGVGSIVGNLPAPTSVFTHTGPFSTLLISGFRERTLLRRGDTDMSRAAKNVAIDGASVLTGAKIGALAGIALGPVGVIFGTAVGG